MWRPDWKEIYNFCWQIRIWMWRVSKIRRVSLAWMWKNWKQLVTKARMQLLNQILVALKLVRAKASNGTRWRLCPLLFHCRNHHHQLRNRAVCHWNPLHFMQLDRIKATIDSCRRRAIYRQYLNSRKTGNKTSWHSLHHWRSIHRMLSQMPIHLIFTAQQIKIEPASNLHQPLHRNPVKLMEEAARSIRTKFHNLINHQQQIDRRG